MLGLIVILVLGLGLFFYKPRHLNTTPNNDEDMAVLGRYWQDAYSSLKDKKYLRAEKALLNILRIDERNATAYNRLGILYAKQNALRESIECFEIAQSLEANPSNLHNVGLIYYNVGDYSKAALAFEQALAVEDNIAIRHIAYAKVQEKLGNLTKMTEALEKAVELEENPQSLRMLASAYEQTGQTHLAADLRTKAEKMIIKQVKPLKVRQQRKVIM